MVDFLNWIVVDFLRTLAPHHAPRCAKPSATFMHLDQTVAHMTHSVSSCLLHCVFVTVRTRSIITCPGGIGTFEELSEFMCQRQLGLHRKPIALLNTRGFYDALLQQFAHMIAEGFLTAVQIESLIVDDDVASLLDKVVHRRQTVQRRIKNNTHAMCKFIQL